MTDSKAALGLIIISMPTKNWDYRQSIGTLIIESVGAFTKYFRIADGPSLGLHVFVTGLNRS